MLDTRAAPWMTGYVSFLEEANRSLGEANARLARERLGVHDAAAAALRAAGSPSSSASSRNSAG